MRPRLDVPGLGEVSLTDPDGDHIYEATFVTGDRATLESGAIRLCVTCHLIRRCTDGTILIDPYGVVYNAALGIGSPLKDAQVMCLEDKGGAAFGLWNAADTGQINPQMTQADGWFQLLHPARHLPAGIDEDGLPDLPQRRHRGQQRAGAL